MKTQFLIAPLLTLAVAFGAPALASAAPVVQTRDSDTGQVTVSYADLNLNSAAGQARLKMRIRQAARTVCGLAPDNKDLGAVHLFDACVRKSIGAAMAAVPAPSVVAGNNGHNG